MPLDYNIVEPGQSKDHKVKYFDVNGKILPQEMHILTMKALPLIV